FEIVAEENLVECIDPVQYTIRLLLPAGSLLLCSPHMAGLVGPFDPVRLTHSWKHPDPHMDDVQKQLAAIANDASGAPGGRTFLRRAALGAPGRKIQISPLRGDFPRLTEDWFC